MTPPYRQSCAPAAPVVSWMKAWTQKTVMGVTRNGAKAGNAFDAGPPLAAEVVNAKSPEFAPLKTAAGTFPRLMLETTFVRNSAPIRQSEELSKLMRDAP